MPRTFLIDTDTASDDAVALIMALRSPDVRVAAITVVAGNVPVEQATRNALFVSELCGSQAPVYAGAGKPLWRPYAHAEWFHGKDGLGDRGYPAPRRSPEPAHAVDALIETVRANPGLTLVTLGPLTNVALALARDPSLAALVGRCVLMGGNAWTVGNVTPAAEYNVWVDPEAARMVLRSGMPIELVPWHLCCGPAVLNQADIDHVLGFRTTLAQFAIDCNSAARRAFRIQTGEDGISLPDPVAMSVALDPSIATSVSPHYTEVEVCSELTRGMTVIDRLNVAADERNSGVWSSALAGPKTSICWTIDVARWKQALYTALQS